MSSVDDEHHPSIEVDIPDVYESASDCEKTEDCTYLGSILKAKKSLRKTKKVASPGIYPGSAGALSSLSNGLADENRSPTSAEVSDSVCGQKSINSVDLRFRGLRG